MPGSPPKIGDPGRERVRMLGARRRGVTVPEVAEDFGVSVLCARRFVLRLVREGVLERAGDRRRRHDVYGRLTGPGGFVYRAKLSARSAPENVHTRSWARRGRGGTTLRGHARQLDA
jgi:hypothetical protein